MDLAAVRCYSHLGSRFNCQLYCLSRLRIGKLRFTPPRPVPCILPEDKKPLVLSACASSLPDYSHGGQIRENHTCSTMRTPHQHLRHLLSGRMVAIAATASAVSIGVTSWAARTEGGTTRLLYIAPKSTSIEDSINVQRHVANHRLRVSLWSFMPAV